MIALCRSCRAAIIWAETVNGARVPIDEGPDPNGIIVLEEEGRRTPLARYLTKEQREQPPAKGEERFTSHFATCPNSEQHRRKR